jgi:hypothetical protein
MTPAEMIALSDEMALHAETCGCDMACELLTKAALAMTNQAVEQRASMELAAQHIQRLSRVVVTLSHKARRRTDDIEKLIEANLKTALEEGVIHICTDGRYRMGTAIDCGNERNLSSYGTSP